MKFNSSAWASLCTLYGFNSGRSTEPHLHLHCQRGTGLAFGVGLPLIFLDKTSTVAANDDPPERGLLQRGMQLEARERNPARA